MILDIAPLTVFIGALLISILAPKWLAAGVYISGLLLLYLSAGTAIADHGLRTQWFILGQMVAWVIPGIIVAFHSVFEPEDRPHWTYTTVLSAATGARWLISTILPSRIGEAGDRQRPPAHDHVQPDHTLVPDEDRFTTTLEHEVETIDDFRT